ncbi:hypothetical protein J7S78_14075 [Klebsiella oxytoca]|uniref:Uncharacterized protein n=1 Tax=Klebsiella oxytoca TaxID=571 RepID=A0AAP2BIK5_KLEOX|nr:hypothetical protein [Klebsiella oxytoca]MBQ0600922.1 hypothetical protein [Klebsiella oxytoca]
MKNFSDIISYLNISNRKPSIGQVRSDVTSWGKTNRSSRHRVKITLWLDSEDKDDRIVISGEVVLNIKKTAPEKGVDLNIDVHHYSGYDKDKRKLTTSHPEQYFRIDGQTNPDDVKSFYVSLCEQIGALELDDRYSFPGLKDYKAA